MQEKKLTNSYYPPKRRYMVVLALFVMCLGGDNGGGLFPLLDVLRWGVTVNTHYFSNKKKTQKKKSYL
jgi:hypothetical protein